MAVVREFDETAEAPSSPQAQMQTTMQAELQARLQAQTQAKMRMLEQMAEALEDEAAGLYRRAAVYEEEEFLLSREIEERQTEINRLTLKLDALRADRDNALERIDALTSEASALRDEVYSSEEKAALATLAGPDGTAAIGAAAAGEANNSFDSTYFRRLRPADVTR